MSAHLHIGNHGNQILQMGKGYAYNLEGLRAMEYEERLKGHCIEFGVV